MRNILGKKLSKTDFIVIILIGVLILIVAVPSGSKKTSVIQGDSNSKEDSDERKLENILEKIDGVGEVNVMITTDSDENAMFDKKGKVEGIVIVAQGAGNPTVDKNIMEIVLALFDVAVHKIKIVKMTL